METKFHLTDTEFLQDDVGGHALVKRVRESAPDAQSRFDMWQRARQLRHPHLLEVLDVGATEVDGERYLYAAFEQPDDNLSAAIEHGPLSEEETREIVDAALDALRYLHGQGLVHGALDPHHIVAVGNTIKLATDSLRESDNLEGHAEDVRQLGELVKTLLAPNEIGEPLRTVVEHATEPEPRNRWTLAEIAIAMHGTCVPHPPQVAAPLPPPVLDPIPSLEAEAPATRLPAVLEPPMLPPPVRRAAVEPPSPIVGFPKWIFAALAGVLVLILAVNLRRGPETVKTPVTTTMAERIAPMEPVARPVAPPPVRARKPSPLAPKPASAEGKAMWRVIAFTYGSQDAASKKARQLNERWPDLHATVFSPKDRRGYYLVALGGRMKREDALRVQQRARGVGLPRDIYIQNYSE